MKIYSALWMMYGETFKLIINKLCMEAQAANLFLRAPIDGGPYFRPTTLIVELNYGLIIFFSFYFQVVQLTNLKKPIYVQFSVLFPTS